MFYSRVKHPKVVSTTSVEEKNEDMDQQLSYNSRKRKNKIDAQATEITMVKTNTS